MNFRELKNDLEHGMRVEFYDFSLIVANTTSKENLIYECYKKLKDFPDIQSNKGLLLEWVRLLESGRFKQIKERLHNPGTNECCVLGVYGIRYSMIDPKTGNYKGNGQTNEHYLFAEDESSSTCFFSIEFQKFVVILNDLAFNFKELALLFRLLIGELK